MLGHGRPSHPDTAPYSARYCCLLPLRVPPCATRSLAPCSYPSRAPLAPLAPRSSLPPVVRPTHLAPCFGREPRRLLPPAARAARPPEPMSVLLVVVLARRHWFLCWCCSRATARRRIPPRRSESTGLDLSLPYVANVFQVFQMFQRYVAIVTYGCCKNRS
jgi:hypothetical protein